MLASLGCTAPAPRPERPNIVLITVDTLRADRLGPYGYDKIATPAIARLAGEGIVFEKAFADASWTLPSLSSVMTGKYPTRHKMRSWNDRLHAEHETLAEVLAAQGYATAAIVGSYPLDRYFGLAQGFDHYDDEMTVALYEDEGSPSAPRQEVTDAPADDSEAARATWQWSREWHNAYRTDREVADKAIEWLNGNPVERFFLWVHFFGPHEKGKRGDLDAAAQKAYGDAQVARYDSDVVETDRQVGRLLEALRGDPRFPATALIFHSDHGQSLNEHGIFGHGFELYDTNVHVPLIIRLPQGERAGERVAQLVRNLDIFATVIDLAGAGSNVWDSRDLLGAPPPADGHVYMETHHPVGLTAREVEVGVGVRNVGLSMRGIRTNRRKLINHVPALGPGESPAEALPDDYVTRRTRSFLFDLTDDPGERRDLAAQRAKQLAHHQSLLDSHEEGPDHGAAETDLDDAAKERLRSLGYAP